MAKILLVDDEESIRVTIGEFIREEGYEVQTAENVTEAFELMKKQNFDVIVTDIIMPKITGIELLKKMHETSPDIPIVMMTGEPEVKTASAAVRAGAFDYLAKPISSDAIKKVIRNAVKTKTLNDEKNRLEEENRHYQENLEELVEERTREVITREEEYQKLFEQSNDAIFIHYLDGMIRNVNQRACELLGYPKEQLLAMNISDFHPEKAVPTFNQLYQNTLKEGSNLLEIQLKNMAGEAIDVEISSSVIDHGETIIQAIVRDITDRKTMEANREEYVKKLHVLHNRFKTLVANNPDGILIVDAKGTIIFVNPSVESLLTTKPEELIGSQFEYPQPVGERMEIDIFSGDGEPGTAELRMVEIEWEGEDVNLVMLHDITENKRLEEKRKELESMKSDFIILNAHELGTPLMVIDGYIDILKDYNNQIGEDGRDAIRHIEMNLKRIEKLQKAMYNIVLLEKNKFSLNKTLIFIHHIAKNVLNELKIMAERKGISFVSSFPTYDTILADGDRIHKVLSILVDNAIRYTPEGGVIEISGSENDSNIELTVKDNGIGIARNEFENIFKEFFQVEAIMGHKDGFGLGLSLAKGIIESHGGHVWVESEPNKGSTFCFTLPKNNE